jgi:hypothetical protein
MNMKKKLPQRKPEKVMTPLEMLNKAVYGTPEVKQKSAMQELEERGKVK